VSAPKVSVLVPVYRTDPAILRETIGSVLRQTFGDFEIVVLDDCPSDPRRDVVSAIGDPRISYSANERNLGISETRNRLLGMARGEYLAILDHDDICRQDRLEKEVAYLDAHPECGVVSSFMRLFPSGALVSRPVTDRAIRIRLTRHCAMVHSAAMMRASVLRASGVRYRAEYSPSEDYRLFFDLMDHTKFHCIPEPLLDYRVHAENTTGAQQDKMIAAAVRVQEEARSRYPELCRMADGGEDSACKVVVSGGWSYGNLGDDAIMEATARLLWRHLPEAGVSWMAYDESFARESGAVPMDGIVPSIHRFMDRGWSFWMLQTMWRSPGYILWPRFVRRMYERLLRRRQVRRSAARDGTRDSSDIFKGADLYVMSGGGYFNMWPTKFDACVREIELARENGCRIMLVGQSIGPFTDEQKFRLKAALRPEDVVFVRDGESVAELAALGVKASLMPDLALGFPKDVAVEKGLLTLVPGALMDGQDAVLSEQVAAVVRAAGSGMRLRIVQTCTLWPDVLAVRMLRRRFCALGLPCEVVMPRTYAELLSAIEGSEIVVSRRMHAMVIGWRSGSRVFALTKSRKIDGFLAKIGCPGNFCAEEEWNRLSEKLPSAIAACANAPDRRVEVAKEVDVAFRECLSRCGFASADPEEGRVQ